MGRSSSRSNRQTMAGEQDSMRRLQGTVLILLCLSAALFYWTTKVSDIESTLSPDVVEARVTPAAGVAEPGVTTNADTAEAEVTPAANTVETKVTAAANTAEAEATATADTVSTSDAQAAEAVKTADAISLKSKERCSAVCAMRRKARDEHFGGNVFDVKTMLDKAKAAKQDMIRKMKTEYGEDNYKSMFEDVEGEWTKYGFFAASAGTESLEYARQKMKIKVMSVHKALTEKERNVDGCDCVDGDKALDGTHESMTVSEEQLQIADGLPSFVWTTGGHSASAGHGNLFNETYTRFMEDAVKGVFAAVGLNFEGRNYAMGGTGSGPEIAFCNQAIFGFDYDVLSWDYGMTDGKNYNRITAYGLRAGLSPSHPLLVLMNAGGHPSRAGTFKMLGEMGMGTFVSDESERMSKNAIPDSALMTQEQVEKLPPMIRYFKCNGALEKGDPFCGERKFSKFPCGSRKGKTSWHPGWKNHHFTGTRMALFLSQLLIESMEQLVVELGSATSTFDHLKALQDQETARFEAFKAQPLPPMGLYSSDKTESFDAELMLRTNGICKTGRTPSFTRYSGALTATDKTGTFAPPGQETYDVGITLEEAIATDAKGEMRLAWHKGRETCPFIVKPDYKDFYIATAKDGWTKLTIPNEKEKEMFGYDAKTIKGLIMVCPGDCEWGKCPKEDIRVVDMTNFESKAFEMKVNNVPVTKMVQVENCVILHSAKGPLFAKKADGTFDIQLKANTEDGYARLGAVAIF